jgi:hypothetical protein
MIASCVLVAKRKYTCRNIAEREENVSGVAAPGSRVTEMAK